MVRVHEHVPGAALLEELRPATPLAELVEAGRDDEATSILADIVAAMLEVTPATAGHATAADQRADFDRYLASGDNGIATALVEEARERWAVLCRTQTSVRLLHGDLQHHNILRDAERGWVAIDPKGVVAEIELELAPALRNPIGMPELYTSAAIERRVSRLADVLCVDPGRVVAWTFAQAVLSAIWTIEDGGAVDPDGPALSVARAARELLLR
ncbi:MAG: aminoglycoside phosphotransferase family protein, partial [Longimicrobiales bacterium]